MPSLRERVAGALGLPTMAQVDSLHGEINMLLEDRRKRTMNATASGVEIDFGRYLYEKNKKLQGDERWSEYAAMVNDPAVTSALRGVSLPLIKAEWEIKPASDDERDVEIAEFCAANLLRQPSDRFGSEFFCTTPWRSQRLPEILDCLESGYSMFAKSTRVVNNKLVYDRLQWLEPSSVDPMGWKLDKNDNIEQVKRTYADALDVFKYLDPLEAWQISMYTHGFKGARYEGRAFIRPMWGAFTRKSFVDKMKAIWSQKVGAPAPYGFWPDGWTTEDKTRFVEFIEQNRGSTPTENYFAGPQGKDGKDPVVGYAGVEADLDRGFTSIINGENSEIARAGGNKSMMLGETESGSRSLGDSQGLQEMIMVEALGQMIAEQMTHGVGNLRGEVEELTDWNYGNVRSYPEVAVTGANPFAQKNSLDAKITAWEKNIIPKTPEARRQLVEGDLGINLKDEDYDVEEPPPLPIPGQPGSTVPGSPPNGAEPPGDGENNQPRAMSLESVEAFRKRIAPKLLPMEDAPKGGKFRGRTQLEFEVMNLAAVEQSFRVGEQDILTELRAAHRGMIDDLMGRLRAGKITLAGLAGQRRSVFKANKKFQRRLVRVFNRVGAEGWAAVADEVGRQNAA